MNADAGTVGFRADGYPAEDNGGVFVPEMAPQRPRGALLNQIVESNDVRGIRVVGKLDDVRVEKRLLCRARGSHCNPRQVEC